MAHTSEFNCNNKVCDNQDSVLKNHEEPFANLDFLLNWSPNDHYLNVEELKVLEGYKVIDEIEMGEFGSESNTNLIKEQLHIRDNLINKLYQYFEKVFSISQQSQIKLKELNKKKKQLIKRIRLLKQRKSSKKLKDKDSKMEANSVDKNIKMEANSVDKNIKMETEESQLNDEKPAEMNTENIGITVPKTEIFSNNIEGSNAICSDENEPDTENSKQDIHEVVDCDIENSNDSTDLNWNPVDVKEEVRELATEITQKLGYAFIQELDMYYDHSSGYYYDHKTRLYYDAKTGIYFYYSYETGKYEFHSQASPSASTNDPSLAHAAKPTNEKEDGEYSDSDEYMEEEISQEQDDIEVAPALRLMVMNGDKKGTLHLVTVDGGKIGREGDLQVLLKCPTVSKVHAEITYRYMGPYDHHYYLQDLGSINGTFIRGERLSETKEVSDIHEIGHGFEIKCGDVILCCHIHPGLLTCNECEQGLVAVATQEKSKINETANGEGLLAKMVIERRRENEAIRKKFSINYFDSGPAPNEPGLVPVATEEKNKINETAYGEGLLTKMEIERRRQNKAIRKKFSINYFDSGPAPNNNPKYKDRAAKRRVEVGSDNPYEKTQVASINTNITRANKGFQLMEKMGWSEGQRLGVGDSGLLEPVVPPTQTGRTGLGCRTYSFDVDVKVNSQGTIQQRIMAHSKLMNSSQSSSPQNSEKTKGFQPIQFKPSSNSNNIT